MSFRRFWFWFGLWVHVFNFPNCAILVDFYKLRSTRNDDWSNTLGDFSVRRPSVSCQEDMDGIHVTHPVVLVQHESGRSKLLNQRGRDDTEMEESLGVCEVREGEIADLFLRNFQLLLRLLLILFLCLFHRPQEGSS